MQKKLSAYFYDDGMKARAVRGTMLSVVGFGGLQLIRLISNLILTRLLFPEAFGLMALVFVFISAIEMFSDIGIHPAIIQSKRGDDPAFLNTAWTAQVLRGVILWIIACAVTVPLANLYEQDALKQIMPVLSFVLVINGFKSTRISTSNRHLQLGRLTGLELAAQLMTTVFIIAIALWWQSVWALVIGTILGAAFGSILSHVVLAGIKNRIFWEKAAFAELFNFGKYIFFSTVAGYFVLLGDRLILGKAISLTQFAVYTIAVMFGHLPLALGRQIGSRVLLPLYHQRPPQSSESNYRAIGNARLILMAGLIAVIAVFSALGIWIIELLYDPRYYAAGPILVLVSLSIIPSLFLDGYSQLLLATGNARKFLIYVVFHAVCNVVLLLLLVPTFGVLGAILAVFVASVMAYPFVVHQIRPYRGWYPRDDALLCVMVLSVFVLTFWVNPEVLNVIQAAFLPEG